MITEHAPAKINLYLHVLGKREDGYHLLDSLVVFAAPDSDASDWVNIKPAQDYSLLVEGPEAGALQAEDPKKNLVTKALRSLAAKTGHPLQMAVTLYKKLPVASGIGGGSADAAAALRAAAKFWKVENHPALLEVARETGADVPACLTNASCYFGGVGEVITPVSGLPSFYLVLVNPNIPLPTADVFKARQGGFSPAARFEKNPASAEELAAMLKTRCNDLQEAAIGLCEAIQHCLDLLEAQPGCLLARMSGSGATCFGIFANKENAEYAAKHIRHQIREYWVAMAEAR